VNLQIFQVCGNGNLMVIYNFLQTSAFNISIYKNWQKHDGDLQLHTIFCLGHDSPMVDVGTNQIFSRCDH